jgi:DDE_Tnp_1-associated
MQNPHPKLSLLEHFQDPPDPRVNRTKDHDLIDILVMAICALLCAGESFNDMEDFGKAKRDGFKTFWTQAGLRHLDALEEARDHDHWDELWLTA